ncbi:hypothetical protein RRG08_033885 [Elysia crispata]|uniref:Uncharacterized protein n=1 Tax=Elysia crispata TaxID=231223 RepID=A0AAE1B8F4_9GAST|nr:hypothetical protein RRG08_033885 [Elysia crispata]
MVCMTPFYYMSECRMIERLKVTADKSTKSPPLLVFLLPSLDLYLMVKLTKPHAALAQVFTTVHPKLDQGLPVTDLSPYFMSRVGWSAVKRQGVSQGSHGGAATDDHFRVGEEEI